MAEVVHKVREAGASQVVTIPREFGLQTGKYVKVRKVGKEIIISKVK